MLSRGFQSFKTDLGILNPRPEIHVWKDTNLSGYTIASNIQWFLYWTQNAPKEINLIIHSLPKDNKNRTIKNVASSEFLKFLSSTYYDLNRLNPKRLHNLINEYISAEAIYKLNKENSFQTSPYYELRPASKTTLIHTISAELSQ